MFKLLIPDKFEAFSEFFHIIHTLKYKGKPENHNKNLKDFWSRTVRPVNKIPVNFFIVFYWLITSLDHFEIWKVQFNCGINIFPIIIYEHYLVVSVT